MNNDWLNRNVAPLIALATVGFAFVLFMIASLVHIEAANEKVLLYVMGAVTAALTTVLGYFFGSSQGSARKTEILTKEPQAGTPAPPAA